MKYFYQLVAMVFIFGLVACDNSDRLQLRFANADTRDEAQRVELRALSPKTSDGRTLSCSALLDPDSELDFDLLDVVKSSSTALPQSAKQPSLLVQLPQGDYLFFAEALDDFSFVVAKGCVAGTLNASTPLQREILLQTVPAPSGRLALAGETQWLQHSGAVGLRSAPSLFVQTLDAHGLPMPDVELRVRVTSGDALPLALTLRSDSRGYASTQVLVSTGISNLQIHARGLQDSPITFVVTGLPSPEYSISDRDLGGSPVAVVSGNLHFDDRASTDVVVISAQDEAGVASIWRGADVAQGLWFEQWQDLTCIPEHAVTGLLDQDDRPDLVVSGHDSQGPVLQVYHHHSSDGDSFNEPVSEAFPADIDQISQLALGQCASTGFGQDLFALAKVGTQVELLLWAHDAVESDLHSSVFTFVQRFVLPDFVSDAQLALADLDQDGDDDVILQSAFSGVWVVPCGVDVSGRDHGRLYAPADQGSSEWPHLLAQPGTSRITSGDFNDDGITDLIAVTDLVFIEGEVSWRVALGDGSLGDYTFSAATALPLTGMAQVLSLDANADGFLDLLVAGRRPPQQLAILGGDGTGEFAAPLILDTGLSQAQVVNADINLDGIQDIFVLGASLDGAMLQGHLSFGAIQ